MQGRADDWWKQNPNNVSSNMGNVTMSNTTAANYLSARAVAR